MRFFLSLMCASLLGAALSNAQDSKAAIAPGDIDKRLSSELRGELAAVDPRGTAFPTEAVSSGLVARFRGWMEGLSGADGADAGLDGFRGKALVPAESDSLRDRGPFDVERGNSGEGEWFEGREGLGRMLAQFEAHLGDGGGWKVKAVGVDVQGEHTRLSLRVEGHGTSNGRPLGVTCRWESVWSRSRGTDVRDARLLELTSTAYERTLGPRTGVLYSDETAAWLGDEEELRAALVPGLDFWRGRLDTSLGIPLLGHPAGIAVGDVDGDGREDVFLAQPGGLPNRLLLATATGGVRDATRAAGLDHLEFTRSALFVDFDGDGDLDLVLGMLSQLVFFENVSSGDGVRFAERVAVDVVQATSLAAADVDGDGDLDLYACAYASPYDGGELPSPYHDAKNGARNSYLRNECAGDEWSFVDATKEAGLVAGNDRFSFAASFEDYDDDGDPDLYVANDFGRNNLYRNEGGRFTDVSAEAGVEDLAAGMGVAWGDADGDGRMDLLVSNMYSSAGHRVTDQPGFQVKASAEVLAGFKRHARGNTLYLNAGDGSFRDASVESRIVMGRWAWGAIFCDMDLDGRQDIFVPNGLLTQERKDDL